MKKRMLIMEPDDNAGVMLEDARQNDAATFENTTVVALEPIEFAHKIALRDIFKNEDIIKYGEVIGYALKDIQKGQWIHIHNMDDVHGREGRLL
ncbi:MAG: UxaA family hydrolase [Peptococcaceae bacterium]|nr:UxaA family hydrolase [Peptococcaceae bacterium]